MAKRYRWIKVEEDFFRQKEMKAMRKLEGGDSYVIIYQKMMAYSLKNDNRIYFDNVEDSFVKEIALMLDEDVKKIDATLKFLQKVNLVEWVNDDEIVFNQVDELTGSESESTQRVRKHRASKKDSNVTDKKVCNKNVTLEKELDKELELEKDIDKDKTKFDSQCMDENLKQITKTYEENIGPLYPANRQWFIEVAEKIHPSLFEKAIKICIDKSNVTPSYLKGIIKRWIDQRIYTLEEYNAKEMEMANRKNVSKVKTLYKDFLGNNQNQRDKDEGEIDETMLEEIKLLEKEMGIG